MASLVTQLVKNSPAMQKALVRFLGWEDPLKKEKATHSRILAWRIPWTTSAGVAKSQTPLSDFHFHCLVGAYALPLDMGYHFLVGSNFLLLMVV